MNGGEIFLTSPAGACRLRLVHEDGACKPDWDDIRQEEMQAWAEGDVWGFVIEHERTWTSEGDTMTTWEQVDGLWGFYGREWAETRAREDFEAHLRGEW